MLHTVQSKLLLVLSSEKKGKIEKKKKEKEMGEKLSVLNRLTLLKSAGEGSCR